MDGVEEARGPRYRAFISYSHRDAAFGRRLHGRLERYSLPRRLVGRPGRLGPAPARLSPIFRDREELSAAGNLTAEVRAALADSACLIVVCSPAAAASVWVGREIELFRDLHPDRPVLAAVAVGDPADVFPAALRESGGEPLAADFRREGDGPRLALLKLAAGVAGVGLGELVQRDAQRRVARVTAVTAAALTAMVAMGVMTAVALDARAEAERQRAEAEGLVGFMLTDLRDRLKGVGRLDVMTAVNQRALDHYGQDLRKLSPDQLEQRAAAVQALGEDDLRRGDQNKALARFVEARRTTAALLTAEPNSPDRIYAQAQSEFWVASVDYARGRLPAAQKGFEAYRTLARRLVALEPGNIEYRRELGFAEGNLCTVILDQHQDPRAAVDHCAKALAAMEIAARTRPDDLAIQIDLGNRWGWLADACQASGDFAQAERHRLTQERLLERLLAAHPLDATLKVQWIGVERALARLENHRRRRDLALARIQLARTAAVALVSYEPANREWTYLKSQVQSDFEIYDKRME